MDYLRYLQKCSQTGRAPEYNGFRVPITFPHQETEVDPYLVGAWLVSSNPPFYIPPSFLAKYKLTTIRRIPHHYKCNSRDVQLRVFAGIIDTIHPPFEGAYYEFSIDTPDLYSDVVFLARSLGFLVEKQANQQMRVFIHHADLSYDIRVERLGIDDYYGFEIDGNRRFVLGDFTVTHNTIMALKIISLLRKKTLILVHKEFLMNQWIERIADFLPGARVGKIQGQTFDVENKDIVIGMIQTLYDKEFPANAFSSFGLTIIDEVHRIGSEQFSKTLLRIVTPYMLGISATVERKDGLTKVLNMFIGDKIYTEERENDDPVCVRAIEYVCSDPDFNEVVYDYRGNPQYSTMISKLCAYNRRSEFIVRVIADLVKENPENQIMLLGQQRAILTYMFDAINHRGIATVGYYVGGMKQGDLQETESKQIVLATYAMAAEALDIKTLSTLVMITPKTDIIQSVGRILRVKHDNPIVVDIVDKHDLFQKQWAQRRRFYKKCGYRIRQIDSVKYAGMTIDWEHDQTWRRVFEPKSMPGCNTKEDGDSTDDETKEKPLITRKCMIDMSDWGDV
jgi:superfamily II DNA or RNA helicase